MGQGKGKWKKKIKKNVNLYAKVAFSHAAVKVLRAE